MILCPYCDHENISGADVCQQCGHSLSDLNLPVPATEVERSLLKDRVESLASIPPMSVTPDTEVREILRLLKDHSVGCAVVVEHGKLVGVFSERDALLKLGAQAAELGDRPVREFMTANPQSLRLDAKIAFAVQRMELGGFRHVPIVNADNEPLGVISVRDILRYLTQKMSA